MGRHPVTFAGHDIRVTLRVFTVVCIIAAMTVGVGVKDAVAAGPNAVQHLPGCNDNVLDRNDDGSTSNVPLPFSPNFFGSSYDELFVNNNGNVTFNSSLSTYTPFGLDGDYTGNPIIAPFFADVDTRGAGSDVVRYGATTFGGHPAFCAMWDGVGVGYYSGRFDKLNNFQLLLIDRGDVGAGDFDIVFNYDQVQWETGEASGGSNGLGGSSAAAGFSNGSGQPGTFFEMNGSLVNGAFLDTNTDTGLIHNNRNSLQLGRYIFEVRNGEAPTGGTIKGKVVGPGNAAVPGAPVDVCPLPLGSAPCNVTQSSGSGNYLVSGLDSGNYRVTAYPPMGTNLLRDMADVALAEGATKTQNLLLRGPDAPPPGTNIGPTRGSTTAGAPVVYWTESLVLTTLGCEGGSARYEVRQGPLDSNGIPAQLIRGGGMSPTDPDSAEPETFRASVAPFFPNSGLSMVLIFIECPNPANNQTIDFTLYIDPSGVVEDTNGDPISGATVKLYRSDSSSGPFDQVPDGSSVMAPSNRENPDSTDSEGRFGWDVLAGYYIVSAEATGCANPDDADDPTVETDVLTIPLPVTNLELVLDCGEEANPDTDGDGYNDDVDNCPSDYNPDQADNDGNGGGNACDLDDDNDGRNDTADNCQFVANTNQANNDGDSAGDACDPDDDNDGRNDTADNCQFVANTNQANNDGDSVGDACDPDDDNDGRNDTADNCQFVANTNQANNDGDSAGDLCDPDDDNDTVADTSDNCQFAANSNQRDTDGDGVGDACDSSPSPAPCTITGTEGNDVIVGTNGNDVICGLGGNDRISGGNGNDVIVGGQGDDTLAGDNGNDNMYGGNGNDNMNGNNGVDNMWGGNGNDVMQGESADDNMWGEAGMDNITGGLGTDRIDGGADADTCSDAKDIRTNCP